MEQFEQFLEGRTNPIDAPEDKVIKDFSFWLSNQIQHIMHSGKVPEEERHQALTQLRQYVHENIEDMLANHLNSKAALIGAIKALYPSFQTYVRRVANYNKRELQDLIRDQFTGRVDYMLY